MEQTLLRIWWHWLQYNPGHKEAVRGVGDFGGLGGGVSQI